MTMPQTPINKLCICFTGDWHVGEGAGQPGHIDHIIRRDPLDNLPYLPAKTLTGIWRDACERIAAGLDKGQRGPWTAWLEALFGDQPNDAERSTQRPDQSPVPARLSVRPGRLATALRDHLRAAPALKEALTFLKPGVRIDRESGQALDDHLRFEEVVRTGAVLEADFTLDLTGFDRDGQHTAWALLWAGAQSATRLGGNRRRGLGSCRFELFEAPLDAEQALRRLKQPPPPPPSRPVSAMRRTFSDKTELQSETEWLHLGLAVELLTPVVVPRATVANVVYSLDYIPGAYLLGVVSKLLGQADAGLPFSAVAQGAVRLGNAYLEVQGVRGLPVPLALHYDKDSGGLDKANGKVWNRLVEPQPPVEQAQLKSHRAGYVGSFTGQQLPVLCEPELQLTTHSTIEDQSQRPTATVGGVFTYEAIPAGIRLRAVLSLHRTLARKLDEQIPDWQNRLTADIRLGKAKKDDYGHARLSLLCETLPIMPPDEPKISGERLYVWLLSDLLLRDAKLRSTTALDDLQRELERRLNVHLAISGETDDATLPYVLRTRRSDGWQQDWGLPRPSYVGLMAGSCLVFTVTAGQLTTEALRRLTQEGLGERRAEGFGEICFNHALLSSSVADLRMTPLAPQTDCTQDLRVGGGDNPPKPLPPLSGTEQDYARQLERVAWRQAIRYAAMSLADSTEQRRERFHWTPQKPPNSQLGALRDKGAVVILKAESQKPPNSQLGALRAVLMGVRSWQDRNRVTEWRGKLQESGNRKDKWPSESLEVIDTLIESKEAVWNWLRKELIKARAQNFFPTTTVDAEQTLYNDLWAEALRTLFAAAIRAEQRDREKDMETEQAQLQEAD